MAWTKEAKKHKMPFHGMMLRLVCVSFVCVRLSKYINKYLYLEVKKVLHQLL